MCIEQIKKKNRSKLGLYIIVIVLAILAGLSGVEILNQLSTLISELFIKAFKCISSPIIFLSIIVACTKNLGDEDAIGMKMVWSRTVLYTLGTTLMAALLSLFLYQVFQPANVHAPVLKENLIPSLSLTSSAIQAKSYGQYLQDILPDNILSPFVEHQIISILILSIVIGLSIRALPLENRQTVVNFMGGLHGIFLNITAWIIKMIPLALFGFIASMLAKLKTGSNFSGLAAYLGLVVSANLLQGLVVLPLWLFFNKIAPFKTMYQVLPALSLAFFSKTSVGTLPLSLEMAEKRLGVDSKISRFVLPLCTSINMNGCAAFIFTTVVYVLQNNGTSLSFSGMLLWVFIATIAAIGNAGVPMGCFFLSASLLSSMNESVELLGLIFPFYALIDMLETALNVWSDLCVVALVDQKAQEIQSSHRESVSVLANSG
ncbi:MAG: dicarboxylate/amino acid:cation symporter [Gammaproteobacteria bacterium]